MRTIHTPPNKCLDCGRLIDAASDPYGKKKPRPGDISICLRCGGLAMFSKDLTLRPMTDDEMYAIAGHKKMLELQKARSQINFDEPPPQLKTTDHVLIDKRVKN